MVQQEPARSLSRTKTQPTPLAQNCKIMVELDGALGTRFTPQTDGDIAQTHALDTDNLFT